MWFALQYDMTTESKLIPKNEHSSIQCALLSPILMLARIDSHQNNSLVSSIKVQEVGCYNCESMEEDAGLTCVVEILHFKHFSIEEWRKLWQNKLKPCKERRVVKRPFRCILQRKNERLSTERNSNTLKIYTSLLVATILLQFIGSRNWSNIVMYCLVNYTIIEKVSSNLRQRNRSRKC